VEHLFGDVSRSVEHVASDSMTDLPRRTCGSVWSTIMGCDVKVT
jgi:hypothetical protein